MAEVFSCFFFLIYIHSIDSVSIYFDYNKFSNSVVLERQESDRRLQEMVSSKYSLLIELLGPVVGVDVGK